MSSVGGAFNEQLLRSHSPSIFELFAQEAMATALQPAIEYVVKVVSHNFPTLLGRLWTARDEIFLLVNFMLESFSIGNHDASFTEHFYNMKRVIDSDGAQLTRRTRIISCLLLVIVPYLRVKLENYYVAMKDIYYNSTTASHDDTGSHDPISYYMLKFYPMMYFVWESLFLVYRLRYLFQKSKYYSPLLWAAGVKLSRIPDDEMMSNSTSLFSLLLGNMLPAVAFSLKFLQWWYSGDQRWAGLGSLPAPPPPSTPPPHPQGVRVTSNHAHCALCEYPYTTPTALQTSGHVFCYTCIHDYVRKHGCCPVTKQPTNETQLIRLFVQQS